MKARKTPKDYHDLAKSHGFEWLGPQVTNNRIKTKWRCDKGHEWDTAYGQIKSGKGCPYCKGNAPKTPENYHDLAKKRGFKWLGPEVTNTQTKTTWECDKGHQWKAIYNSIQRGYGCPSCAVSKRADEQRHKSTHYYTLAKSRNFKWLGPEVSKTSMKTSWQCPCGYIWGATYNNIQRGKGCPSCGGSLPKTEVDYRALATRKNIKWRGGNLPPNVRTKTKWECTKGHQWEATYDSVSRNGCFICGYKKRSKKRRMKPEKYHALAKRKGIQWLGPEVNNQYIKTKWECTKGHQWGASYMATKQLRLCPICNNVYPKTEDDYHALAKNKGFKWTGEILPRSVKTKTKWQCSKGHQWGATYDSVTRNGCPVCYESKGEKRISEALDKLDISYYRQHSFDQCKTPNGHSLYFDFLVILPNKKVFLVEYDGKQHYHPIDFYGGKKEFLKRTKLDTIKNRFAKSANIPLLRIPYTSFDDIEAIIISWVDSFCQGSQTTKRKSPEKGMHKFYKDKGRWVIGTQLMLFPDD